MNIDKKIHILLAEDNQVNQEFINILLKKKGFYVTCVSNGKEAFEAISKSTYDLILMDIEMPEMDGLETTIKIREIDNRIPIIALTAYALKGDKEKCFEAGMNDYIAKPIKIEELINKILKYTNLQ